MGRVALHELKAELEGLYQRYHQKAYREVDPVTVVWEYSNPADQEIAGLWAALFAWGRRSVAIQKVRYLLAQLGPSPAEALRSGQPLTISWRHRTWSPADMQALWQALGEMYAQYSSLEAFFFRYRTAWQEGICAFQECLLAAAPQLRRHIGYIPAGSASKRLQLWLRWMVRRDEIDPGPWRGFSPVVLFVPIDVHVAQWAYERGLLRRPYPSWQAVQHLTEVFLALSPDDPLRYDFALVTASSLHRE